MKELADIIALARAGGVAQAALATVVRVEGSSYRRPGASLLIGADGRRLGSVSGGCLERDVESHAKAVMATGQPRLVTYDTRDDADVIFGTALGCGGLVEVFIEPVDLQDAASPVGRWAAAADRREAIAELIMLAAPDGASVAAGQRVWIPLGRPAGDAAGSTTRSRDTSAGAANDVSGVDVASAEATGVLREVIEAARPPIAARQSSLVTHATPAGEVRAFVRVIEPPVRLLICGAGDDSQPLAQMAIGLGWRVWVVDHRAGFAKPERFPGAERVECVIAGTLPSELVADPRTVAMVMNHHYPADKAWLTALAPLPLPYLGLLGARHRTARLLEDANLPAPGPGGLPQLFAPAGLDIGGEGADAIALAMIAEMQAVITGRRGGPLRDIARPIHASSEAQTTSA